MITSRNNMNFGSLSAFSDREPIAVIGLGCRLPGAANDWRTFWNILETGQDCIRETPAERWNLNKFYSTTGGLPGKTQSKWGGYVQNLDHFDPELFGISPREAASMDPQQRLLLESAFRAVEDAGKRLDQISGRPVAVFVGISSFDYAMAGLSFKDRAVIDAYSNTGGSSSIAANRISYCLDLRGPSVAVDTACSSSLVAVHLACESIWRGESELALAGGVNALILPDFYVAFSQLGVMSPDGRCRTFDAKANGYVRSEGAGMVLLKPLGAAVRDRDPIYAVIRGTALNQDGRTPGMTVPSQTAQEALIRAACESAGVHPAELQYVEAHGTGTAIGDPIEAAAIGQAVGAGRSPDNACWVGSVKTNIGHLESGAGAASLIKVALALHHRRIPKNLHFHQANPAIDLTALGLRVPTETTAWQSKTPRLAGINGFGYGGTNAHLIVEQAPETAASVFSTRPSVAGARLTAEQAQPSNPVLIPVSARSSEALRQSMRRLADWLSGEGSEYHLAEIASYLAHRRSHLNCRTSVCAASHAAVVDQLRKLADSMADQSSHEISGPQIAQGPVFVCCGQGPQWWAMGRGLIKYSPVFRAAIKRCDAQFARYGEWSLLAELEKPEKHSRMHKTSIAQPSIFAIQVALAAVWESWGIRPSVVVGHSVGEIAAAYLSGGLSWEDACLVAFHRGRTMDLASSQGGMLAVGMAPDEVSAWLDGIADQVSLAAINGPQNVTLAGDAAAIDLLATRLANGKIFCRRLAVEYAFHSPQMDPVQAELLESLSGIQPRGNHTHFISTVTGQPMDGRDLDAHYWWRNVRETVRFADAMAWLATGGYGLIVEIGPHPVLSYSISECFQASGRAVRSVASLNRQEDDLQCMSASLGTLYSLGLEIRWAGFYNQPSRKLPVPSYPFQWQRLWNESLESLWLRTTEEAHPLLGQLADHAQSCWQQRIDLRLQSFYADHRVRGSIVYPAAGVVETAIAAAAQLAEQSAAESPDNVAGASEKFRTSHEALHLRLERLRLHNPCILSPDNPCWMETQYHGNRRQITLAFRSTRTPLVGNWNDRSNPDSDRETGKAGQPAAAAAAADLLSRWTSLATVCLSNQPSFRHSTSEHLARVEAARLRCTRSFSGQQLYDYCSRLGLEYGESFQGVVEGCWRAGEAVAEVALPDAVDASGYILHPALLDSCFHVMVAADASFDHALDGLYLPSEIHELLVDGHALSRWKSESPIRSVVVHARVLRKTRKKMWCDLDVTLRDGTPIVSMRGFESQRVLSPSSVEKTVDLIYGYRWTVADTAQAKEPSDGLQVQSELPSYQHATPAGSWVVFMDQRGVGAEVTNRLRSQGNSVIQVFPRDTTEELDSANLPTDADGVTVNPADANDFHRLFANCASQGIHGIQGILYLWALDAPQTEGLTADQLQSSAIWTSLAPLHLTQGWNRFCEESASQPTSNEPAASSQASPRLCLVTCGAQLLEADTHSVLSAVHDSVVCQVAQSPLIGFGRVIISEYGRLQAKLIDLQPAAQPEQDLQLDYRERATPSQVSPESVEWLLREMAMEDGEDEVMWRDGKRWLHRFEPLADQPLHGDAARDLSVQLRPGKAAGIEELRYETKARGQLEIGQVEIQVIAAGLNFSDVMKSLDLYPGLTEANVEMGAECSGRVVRVAPGSRWSEGDEVIAIAPGAFSSHVIANEQLVARKPSNLTHEEAAAIPVAFLTAQYAMQHCARLRRGESILIHAASGGVGLAAIQLANAAGLRILATAGSADKRNYLNRLGIIHVMDSRTLAFGQETLAATAGEGVDAVLNSLPGEAIATGLSVLKMGGRFLEIGKRDIYNDTSLGLFPFRKNLALFAIDLDQLFKHQPAQLGLMLQSLVQRFELGELRPLPTTVFHCDETKAAFRYMQQAKHIGKVVIQYHQKPSQIVVSSYDPVRLRSDRTYWIAGGLGGFGLEIAKWMAHRGAGHLVLSGRSPQVRPETQATLDQISRGGTQITVLPTDITNDNAVRDTLATIDRQLPPLAGVIHTAMVLEDRLLIDLDRSTLERVLWPKVLGGWNLHQQTRDRDLDLFVLFSSLSSIFGHAGQANYSAANSLLDCLAHYRRQQGLPGLVINWGHLGEVGYLAERQTLGQRLERQGVLSFTVQQATDCLEYALQTRTTQLSVLRIDWSLWRGLGITGRVSPRFAHLLQHHEIVDESAGSAASLNQLRSTPEPQRCRMVADLLRTKIASLLGMNPTQVRDDRAPLEMGLDSLMAVELRNWIEAQMEINLQVSALMRSDSLADLTNYLSQMIGQSSSQSTAAPKACPAITGVESYQHNIIHQSSRLDPEQSGFEKISSQEAADLLENLNQMSSIEVSQLLNKLMTS